MFVTTTIAKNHETKRLKTVAMFVNFSILRRLHSVKGNDMFDNIANNEDRILDAIILGFISVLLLMFVVSFSLSAYELIF